MSSSKTAADPSPFLGQRLVSLDQFRGYTVAGMILVNFLGKFDACPAVLKHHNTYNSYADTIMPGFFFAVGFAFRLTFGRRAQEMGLAAAYWRVFRRFVGLGLFAIIFYGAGMGEPDGGKTWEGFKEVWPAALNVAFKREWFQTLLHIAVTCLWITPVIRSGALVRILYMLGSCLLHVFLSYKFYFLYCNNGGNAIDGGPLGFLTWTVPALIGTLACDAVVNAKGRAPLFKLSLAGIFVMVLGYAFSCGTRLYDLPPAELAAHKTELKDYEEEKKVVGDKLGALKKSLEAPQKKINELKEEQKAKKGAVLGAQLAEWRKGQDTAKLPEWIVLNREKKEVDRLEAEFNSNGWSDPRIAEIDNEIATIKDENKFNEVKQQIDDLERQLRYDFPDKKLAPDAVWPSRERIDALKSRHAEQGPIAVLAEPPFVAPPADDPRVDPAPHIDHRLWNYWMMSQRAGSISYLVFAAGFNLLAYVLFYILGDIANVKVGVFRTFGMNALAAYVIHDFTGGFIKGWMPKDVPAWYMWTGFALFFFLTWLFVRTLEKQKIFLRL